MSNRVLIVDDSTDDIAILQRFLADEDVVITGLTDSKETERVFEEFKPDLVLLDLQMPKPDGLEILRRLRAARERLGFIPVVVLTRDIGQAARNNAMDLGADDFLTKPLDRQEVILRVRNFLTTRRLHIELARAYRHKSEFFASMGHELRTQLASIIGFSEVLANDTTGRFDAAARQRFLMQINTSGNALLGLINDILDLSKVEAGQMALRIEKVLIADVVSNAMSVMEPLAAKKSIRLEAVPTGAGHVPADQGKLSQMLLNLVSNAVKFTPEGGVVTITARRLVEAVDISVADNGIGIAEADQENLFAEFRQVEPATTRREQGTGLGLVLTKRLVELHGGNLTFVSELGKGSVFTLRLPLTRPVAEASPFPAASRVP